MSHYKCIADSFRKTVLLDCIYEWYQNISFEQWTVLLEYIDH